MAVDAHLEQELPPIDGARALLHARLHTAPARPWAALAAASAAAVLLALSLLPEGRPPDRPSGSLTPGAVDGGQFLFQVRIDGHRQRAYDRGLPLPASRASGQVFPEGCGALRRQFAIGVHQQFVIRDVRHGVFRGYGSWIRRMRARARSKLSATPPREILRTSAISR
jgi:hypothetical protein